MGKEKNENLLIEERLKRIEELLLSNKKVSHSTKSLPILASKHPISISLLAPTLFQQQARGGKLFREG